MTTETSIHGDFDWSPLARAGQRLAILGLGLFAVFAPHSVAAGSIGVALAGLGWVIRTVGRATLGLQRSKFDLIILLSLLWTIVSSALSEEPRISLIKLRSSWAVFIFYVARAVVTRKTAVILVLILIVSASSGVIVSIYDLVRGRGIVVESLSSSSPFQEAVLQRGDTVWRVAGRRVYSVEDVNQILKSMSPGTPFSISIISQGEHVDREGLIITSAQQRDPSPSGLKGSERSHRFRASGWTRHYETFAELLQMVAQLALGLGLAHFRNHGFNKYSRLAFVAAGLLALGIGLTAMRTVVIAFVLAAMVIAWRSLRGIPKAVFTLALFLVLAFSAVVVWQTRARAAMILSDPSSSLRYQVARVGLSRVFIHPVFGHGMDAMKKHWNEWGFPGTDMLHLHSTPLQLAFDRGLPMLFIWVWLMVAFWVEVARAEKHASDRGDTNAYGILLGTLGALSGFLLSSFVNYNFGDGEAVMLLWFLLGLAMVVRRNGEKVVQ